MNLGISSSHNVADTKLIPFDPASDQTAAAVIAAAMESTEVLEAAAIAATEGAINEGRLPAKFNNKKKPLRNPNGAADPRNVQDDRHCTRAPKKNGLGQLLAGYELDLGSKTKDKDESEEKGWMGKADALIEALKAKREGRKPATAAAKGIQNRLDKDQAQALEESKKRAQEDWEKAYRLIQLKAIEEVIDFVKKLWKATDAEARSKIGESREIALTKLEASKERLEG